MPVFSYKAIDPASSGELTTGTVIADTARAARDQLRQRGLEIEQIRTTRSRPRNSRNPRMEKAQDESDSRGSSPRWFRQSSGQVTTFLREISTLLAVGVPLLEALDTVSQQYRGRFQTVILQLRDDVSSGVALAEAMRRQSEVFDELAIAITHVGENAGTLDDSLAQVADFRERSQQLRGRVGTALMYPLIVLLMGLGVAVFLMSYVVPNLLSMLIESGRPLPTTTLIVKTLSDGLRHWWWLILAGVLGLGLTFNMLLSTERGRLSWDRLQLKLPLLGTIIRKQVIVRLSLIIAALMRSGVEFVDTLRIARQTTTNRVLASSLEDCEKAVIAGRDIGPALAESGAFSPAVVQVFAVGQHSGRLEDMLERLAMDYDKQVQTATARLTALLEPILIIVLATVVGFIAFATVMPILEAGNVL
ncbi:type II secretion system F family protein [Planctomycetales bacterium ZRK34]|nr:type II secretion system F family protein [Planctomycetales bacterium ZRK34]